jgi:hypothetical protein
LHAAEMEESLHFTVLKFLKTSGTIIQRERDVCAFHRCGLGAPKGPPPRRSAAFRPSRRSLCQACEKRKQKICELIRVKKPSVKSCNLLIYPRKHSCYWRNPLLNYYLVHTCVLCRREPASCKWLSHFRNSIYGTVGCQGK